MSTATATTTVDGWIQTIDQYGRGAWITLMVLGFILFWPIGLALLVYLIWSGRMGCQSTRNGAGRGWRSRAWGGSNRAMRNASSGNTAFDEYREETLRRLEDEQQEFQGFLDNLRKAKDKAEFDQFMDAQRTRPQTPGDEPQAAPAQ